MLRRLDCDICWRGDTVCWKPGLPTDEAMVEALRGPSWREDVAPGERVLEGETVDPAERGAFCRSLGRRGE